MSVHLRSETFSRLGLLPGSNKCTILGTFAFG